MVSAPVKLLAFLLCFSICFGNDDVPCMSRQIDGQSVVCVCNSRYCDSITRENPDSGSYIVYSTTYSGRRFDKSYGLLSNDLSSINSASDGIVVKLGLDSTHQSIMGFGGAVTDSAAINWMALSNQTRSNMIKSYFSDSGLEYNMLRVPIGGSDFSTRAYTYNDYPVNDTKLTNFTLTYEDYEYKIPMIQQAMFMATSDIRIVGSCWTPPIWMKTKAEFEGRTDLLDDYFESYALYHLKFVQHYSDAGVKVWAVTTGNEPMDGILGIAISTMGWGKSEMARWIDEYLGPIFRRSDYADTKILSGDDQRSFIEHWFYGIIEQRPWVVKWLDGIAVHWYADNQTSPDILAKVNIDYPEQFVLSTEASIVGQGDSVILGSWSRAEQYIFDIIQDLSYSVVGWMDWNLCLNSQGGPNFENNRVDSPIIVFPDDDEFIKQPMFYAVGHFSKFLPRGSIRLGQRIHYSDDNVTTVSFLTPSDTIVTVILNMDAQGKNIYLNLNNEQSCQLNVDAQSFTTVESRIR